jgi:zinc protease
LASARKAKLPKRSKYQGDPTAVNRDIAELQAVTATDVQRVMRKYFTDTNRVVIYYQQEGNDASKK